MTTGTTRSSAREHSHWPRTTARTSRRASARAHRVGSRPDRAPRYPRRPGPGAQPCQLRARARVMRPPQADAPATQSWPPPPHFVGSAVEGEPEPDEQLGEVAQAHAGAPGTACLTSIHMFPFLLRGRAMPADTVTAGLATRGRTGRYFFGLSETTCG